MENFKDSRVGTTAGDTVPSDSVASISLPPSLLDDVSTGQQRFGFSVFEDGTLFQSRNTPEEFQGLEVGSVVISATLYGSTVSGLDDDVRVQLQKSTVGQLDSLQHYADYFDFAA